MIITQTTQRTNTLKSYVKACELLINNRVNNNILDYGAGLGLGYKHINNIFDDAESFEPYPKDTFKPTYTSVESIINLYDGIICLNVLNVLTDTMQAYTVRKIASLLTVNGVAIVSSRTFKGDLEHTKKGLINYDHKTVEFNNGLTHKGYDNNELIEFIKPLLKDGAYSVERVKNINGNCVLIKRLV